MGAMTANVPMSDELMAWWVIHWMVGNVPSRTPGGYTSNECNWFWGSHGCDLERGHDGLHLCLDPENDEWDQSRGEYVEIPVGICSAYDSATGDVRWESSATALYERVELPPAQPREWAFRYVELTAPTWGPPDRGWPGWNGDEPPSYQAAPDRVAWWADYMDDGMA